MHQFDPRSVGFTLGIPLTRLASVRPSFEKEHDFVVLVTRLAF